MFTVNGLRLVDAHCHIYPEKIVERAVAGTDTFYDTISKCRGDVEGLLNAGKEAGIDKFIVQSVATTPKQVGSINRFIAEEVKKHNEFTGLGTLHPDSDDIKGDIEYLKELGLHGVKLHPDIQQFKIDDYRCLKIYEICEREGLPILMHTGDNRYDYSNPNRLIPVLKIYTGLTVIGAHFGGWSIWEQASRQLCDLPNLYVDCSSSLSYMPSQTALEIIRRYGADRVMFATDYPMWDPRDEMELFLKIPLSLDEQKMIFSENAERIYNLR